MKLDIHHDEARERFVTNVEDKEAHLRYSRAGEQTLDYRSTFVPPAHRNQGIGERIVKHALDWARERGYQVIPSCPFVRWVVDRNEEYREITV